MKKILLVFFLMALGIVAYVLSYYGNLARDARLRRVEGDFNSIVSALKMFEVNTGRMPTEAEGLRALVERPQGWPADRRWSRLSDEVPIDPWGWEYRYTVNVVDGARIRSVGKDGMEGTRDDQERVVVNPEGAR